MKKLTAFLLALLTVTSIFASCSGGDQPSDTTDSASQNETPTETTAAEVLPNYLTLEGNFNGKEFRILGMIHNSYSQFSNFEIDVEAENGDVVNDAVYKRNRTIEEKYNVDIVQKLAEIDQKSANTAHYQHYQSILLAGEDDFDMMFVSMRDAASVINNKFTIDLNTLPYIDFEEDYWNKAVVNDAISINGKLPLTNSDFSLVDKKRCYILAYNRDLHKEYSDLVLEDMVHDGEWTFDVFTELMAGVYSDLNGDGVHNQHDQWGFHTDSPHALSALVTGMGGRFIYKDKDDTPVVNLLDERMVSAVDKVYEKIISKPEYFFDETKVSWGKDAAVKFPVGTTLFMATFPQSLPNYSAQCEFDYGVIVWPKYDEAQERYYTFADRFGTVLFGVPVTNTDHELAGFMLEVLSGYSTDTTLNAYYEVSCKTKYTYDETSADMLDMIFDGLTFDLGTMTDWGGVYTGTIVKLTEASNTYVSTCEGLIEAINTAMAETLELYE